MLLFEWEKAELQHGAVNEALSSQGEVLLFHRQQHLGRRGENSQILSRDKARDETWIFLNSSASVQPNLHY